MRFQYLNNIIEKFKEMFCSSNATATLKKYQARLEKTEQLLAQQEKMAGIGLLTAGIAHEIKNPLNFINNFSKLNIEILGDLKTELKGIDIPQAQIENITALMQDLQTNCEKIQEHGARAQNTVQMMLSQARQAGGPPAKEIVSINKLLEEYANLAYHGMRATNANMNIKFEKHLDSNLQPIPVFPQSIGRVFLNIINNGLYAANQQKQQSNDTEFMPTLSLTTQDKKDHIIIKIKDNGIGIPADQLPKIFEALFSTKAIGQGTGLGLTICQDIIKEHQGTLTVDSVLGKYTEFTIILPKQV